MKTKKVLLTFILLMGIAAGLSSCKAKCDCPRFSKTNSINHTQKALI